MSFAQEENDNYWKGLIESRLREISLDNRYRKRAVVRSIDGGRKLIQKGVSYHNFSSNDYLGMSQHPDIIAAWSEGAERYGVGSTSSAYVVGYQEPIAQLEERLADWLGYERALLYPSGFSANQAIIKVLCEKGDTIIADRLTHASIMEAAALSPATLRRFHHNSIDSLERQLRLTDSSEGGRLIITEGLFSMDGDEAPLSEIAQIAKKEHSSLFMVDDAHGIGIWGEEGRGTTSKQRIKPDILVVTFGKAFGLTGAAILMSEEMAEYFIQRGRSLIYSTAISPAHAYTLHAILEKIRGEEGDRLRSALHRNIAQFRQGIEHIENGRYSTGSNSPIQPIIIGENSQTLDISKALKEAGFWISGIRPPTVPKGEARLRITITALHQPEVIDHLLQALEEQLKRWS